MITESLINFAVNFISSLGYPGVFFLSMLEGLMLPVPLEATLIFSGFLISIGHFNLLNVIFLGSLGNLLGATITFLFFKHIGSFAAQKLIKRYGHALLISQSEFENLNRFFKKHGLWSIIIFRFIPGMRALITIPVGLSKISLKQFMLIYSISSFLIVLFLSFLGLQIASSWSQTIPYIKKIDLMSIAIIIILIALYLKHKLKK